ncbi:MAG: tryptophan synthase subunit beta, partial [Ferruginibacter sp.]
MMTTEQNNFAVNEYGYYGDFGGAFIPEMLYPNVKKLQEQYLQIMQEPAFQQELQILLRDYVGRPTPLFLAERLSEKHGVKVYLKRE